MKWLLLVLVVCCISSETLGQSTLGRWEFSLAGTVQPPARARVMSGNGRPRFYPSPSFNLRIGLRILQQPKREIFIYYTRGSSAFFIHMDLSQTKYTILRQDTDSRFYVGGLTYHAFGVAMSYP